MNATHSRETESPRSVLRVVRPQRFTINVTRKEFLKLPMSIRRRALREQTDAYLAKDCPGCAGTNASHSEYCAADNGEWK